MGSSLAGDLDRSNAAIVGIFDADNQPQNLERLQIAVQCRRMLSDAPRKGADIPLGWLFNVWGFADLSYAVYEGVIGIGISPGALGAAYFLPTAIVPLLFITHGLIFRLLLRSRQPVHA
jgi:hypothetical protein